MSSEDVLSKIPPIANVLVKYGSDDEQFADLYLPTLMGTHANSPSTRTEVIPTERYVVQRVEGSAFLPLAIVVHGGFWRSKYDLLHAGHLCAALTDAGIATLNVEYRRVGNLGGGWPGSFADVTSAFQAISDLAEKYRLDPNRIIVIGHSAGGQLALALAAHQPSLRGVVALAPVSDLHRAYELHLSNDAVVEFLGGTPSQLPELYAESSPIELPIAVPQVIIHGNHDDIVPVDMSRSYVETKRSNGENVRPIEPDCGHFELIDPSSQPWLAVQQSVLELLKP